MREIKQGITRLTVLSALIKLSNICKSESSSVQ